jgi:hypothetical protein
MLRPGEPLDDGGLDVGGRNRRVGGRRSDVTGASGRRYWVAVHDAIAAMPGWAVGPASYHGEDQRWHVTAAD